MSNRLNIIFIHLSIYSTNSSFHTLKPHFKKLQFIFEHKDYKDEHNNHVKTNLAPMCVCTYLTGSSCETAKVMRASNIFIESLELFCQWARHRCCVCQTDSFKWDVLSFTHRYCCSEHGLPAINISKYKNIYRFKKKYWPKNVIEQTIYFMLEGFKGKQIYVLTGLFA